MLLLYKIAPQLSAKFLSVIKRASVFLSTLHSLAIFRRDVPVFNNSEMSTSLPESLYLSGELLLPLGRPSRTPSAFFLANASFVRWLIRFRQISAESPKAKARTLLWMSSPSRQLSLMVHTRHSFVIQIFSISIIINRLRPRRDNSLQMMISSFPTFLSNLPSSRLL